jgi:hypothetical protein
LNYKHCDCIWTDPERAESHLCGCGSVHLDMLKDNIIHWKEKHWNLECAFKYVLERW